MTARAEMAGRVYAIGDIHGCDVALDVVLSKLDLSADDTVVTLGDVVDRGPGTKQAIDRLLQLQTVCNVVFLMGNHEEMMLDARGGGSIQKSWLGFGGRETLTSYGGRFDLVPAAHWEFLEAGLDYWEAGSVIFIHANLEPGVALEQQSAEWLRWTRFTGFERPHPSGKLVVCGHSAQHSGLPCVLDGWACIDTWVYGEGSLTCLDVATGDFMQAKQDGSFRDGLNLRELA